MDPSETYEVQDLADAIELANSSHDHASALASAVRTYQFLDRELGLETHHLRRVLRAITDTLEGR